MAVGRIARVIRKVKIRVKNYKQKNRKDIKKIVNIKYIGNIKK